MPDPIINTPFVIWTLQRTGGTNLNKHLNMLSENDSLQDEPFNRRRECGGVTQAWLDTRDRAALEDAVGAVCATGKNIKHCIERVPWAVSEALVQKSHAAGYAPIFLYREDPMQRLLSMEYAMRTKSWGPKKAAAQTDDQPAFAKPLDVDGLIAHEEDATRKLKKAWRQLRKSGAAPVAVSYEELYASDEAQTRRALEGVFARLGIDTPSEGMTSTIRSTGDQQTRDRYENFDGIEELRRRLDALPQLPFSRQDDTVTAPE